MGVDRAVTDEQAGTRLPASFAAAFPILYPKAYRASYRLLGNRQEAEDVAQEACARACIHWTKITRKADPAPWVVRVATNLAIEQWRRRRRAARHGSTETIVLEPADARRVDLHRALETLPKRQRDTVVLRYVVDLSEAETAEALGCAPGTVKSHAARGLTALRVALGESEPGDEVGT